MRFPDLARQLAHLTTLLALSALYGCSTNDLRGDDVTWDPYRPDKVLDPATERQYQDAQDRERQRQSAVMSARPARPGH